MGEVKPFKSIMRAILMNLVNLRVGVPIILSTRMENKSNFVEIYDKYNYLVVQIVHCM